MNRGIPERTTGWTVYWSHSNSEVSTGNPRCSKPKGEPAADQFRRLPSLARFPRSSSHVKHLLIHFKWVLEGHGLEGSEARRLFFCLLPCRVLFFAMPLWLRAQSQLARHLGPAGTPNSDRNPPPPRPRARFWSSPLPVHSFFPPRSFFFLPPLIRGSRRKAWGGAQTKFARRSADGHVLSLAVSAAALPQKTLPSAQLSKWSFHPNLKRGAHKS